MKRNGLSHSESGKIGYEASLETRKRNQKEVVNNYLEKPNKCNHCDATLPYDKRQNKYCNRSCAAKSNNKTAKKRAKRRKCLLCNSKLSRSDSQYCSRECYSEYKKNNKRISCPPYISVYNCLNCAQKLTPSQNKYCSIGCQHEYRWKERVQAFELARVIDSMKMAKRYLKEKNGIQCNICGLKEWMGEEVPLILDHINGDSGDNDISNLRLVCGNCDMQLPTYKNKNMGKGRAYRRTRYAEGKSY